MLGLAVADSRNILPDERERLAARGGTLLLETIRGSHADCYRNTAEITAAMRDFYQNGFPGIPGREIAEEGEVA